MTWQPILAGADAQRARAVIDAIAAEVIERDDITQSNLINGWAGIALFYGYLAREGRSNAPAQAHAALAHAIELLATGEPPSPWLGTGFTGIAWAMQHLRDVVDVDDETLETVDAMVADLLVLDPWPFEYELLAGLVGLGVYALERGSLGHVERVVGQLERLALRTEQGVTWWNRDGEPPHHNLGMGLGVTGAAAFLAEASLAGVVPERARALLDGAISWLSARERAVTPRFPMCELLEVPPGNVRNGWCYGDLPVACMLVRAGDVPRARDLALAMARGPVEDVTDFNTAICHGAAGRAHMFNRLGQAIGDDELLDAARRYCRETLDRLETTPLTKPGFKTGRSGIALALLAATSAIEPSWDRSLLVALPPRTC